MRNISTNLEDGDEVSGKDNGGRMKLERWVLSPRKG